MEIAMRKYHFLFLSLLSINLGSCTNQQTSNSTDKPPGTSVESRRQWLKDYAFCSCLSYANTADSTYSNDISMGIYRDISAYNQDAYDAVDNLSKITASKISPSVIADYEEKKPILKSCLEYYQSKTLDSLVNKYESNSME
ncbi:hypothetical protein SAMN04488101_102587 [Pedobacter nyackensis]|uniref:Uncharacterized protein n=1 Tax=Pedobacter nyackensis TaxID=475255 RepID=A0A1W2BLN9_9SPHI|nr:hypothetical protein SAMN04488101_102587 [Pedobacter nyackensis]